MALHILGFAVTNYVWLGQKLVTLFTSIFDQGFAAQQCRLNVPLMADSYSGNLPCRFST